MRAVITKDQLKIEDNTLYNSGSIDYYEIDVEFSSDWEGLTKYAVINGTEAVKIPVVENKVKVDRNTSGTYYIGFIGYTIEDDKKTFQISTPLEPIYFQVGAGEINAREAQDLPDPTTWEMYLAEIQAIVDGAENVNITAEKVGDTTYINVTDKTGTTETVDVVDGKDAKINGVNTIEIQGGENVSIVQEGSTLTINATDTTEYSELTNKPSINGVELSGNKTSADLNIKQTYNKSDVGLGNVDNIKQYSADNPPPYPVTSVNGQTGAVVIDTHDDLIPTQASSSNKLATEGFVNSTVATSTATFRGTYNSLAELEQVTADENDYGFVVGTDTAGNTVYNRYKYASGTWTFEYALNNSSFTAAQWDAIQSGITDDLVTKLQGIETGAEVNVIEGLKIGNTTQQVDNKIIEINPDTTPTQNSTNVIDSNAVYEIENMLPTDSASGENVDVTNAQPYKVLDIVADGKYQQDTTTGKNLFNITDYTNITLGNNGHASSTKTSNKITITTGGESVSSGVYITKQNLSSYINNYNSANTYYVSMDIKASRAITMQIGCDTRPNNIQVGTTTSRISVETLINNNGLVIYSTENNEGDTIEVTNIMISTSSDTTYEPYTNGASPNPNFSQPITQVTSATLNRVGKNLFDKNNANISQMYIQQDNGQLVSSSTARSIYIPIIGGNAYTVSRSSKITNRFGIATSDTLPTVNLPKMPLEYIVANDNLSITLITSNTAKYLIVYLASNESDTNLTEQLLNLQIEEGSSATTYEPYQGQSIPIDLDGNEVCVVSNTKKDKLLVDRYGNVAIQKNVGKIVLNGDETYNYTNTQPTDTTLKSITISISDILTVSNVSSISVLTSHFPYAGGHGIISSATTEECFKVIGGTDKRLGFITKQSTKEDFQAWLSNNNVTVYYPLATPTIIPLPKLSILPSTLKGINHIWVDTNLGRTQIEVEYVKDLSLDIPTKTSELTNDANFVKNTDYATSSAGGVIRASVTYGTQVGATGILTGSIRTLEQYDDASSALIISKGTLQNVLAEEIGTIETALTTLDVGGGI